jgi:hypothetical protein
MTQHAESPPFGELFLHDAGRRFGLQAERMAREVDRFAAVGVERMMKLGRERCKRIVGVARERGGGIEFRVFQSCAKRGGARSGAALMGAAP